jgi:hypothetical protein
VAHLLRHGTSVFKVISERPVIHSSVCYAFGIGPITTYFKDLSGLGLQLTTSRILIESTTTRLPQPVLIKCWQQFVSSLDKRDGLTRPARAGLELTTYRLLIENTTTGLRKKQCQRSLWNNLYLNLFFPNLAIQFSKWRHETGKFRHSTVGSYCFPKLEHAAIHRNRVIPFSRKESQNYILWLNQDIHNLLLIYE